MLSFEALKAVLETYEDDELQNLLEDIEDRASESESDAEESYYHSLADLVIDEVDERKNEARESRSPAGRRHALASVGAEDDEEDEE